MNEVKKDQTLPENPGKHQPTSPFSEQLPALVDALECLYIKNNPSGRHVFVQNWPAAVKHVFDERLLAFDEHGTNSTEDKALRTTLEKEAEDNRIKLLEILENIEKRSVDDGLLQIEYVEQFIRTYKRDVALHVYAEHIVDKFVPPAGQTTQGFSDEDLNVEQEDTSEKESEEETPVVEEEDNLLTAEQRAEILGSLGPKLPDIEEKEEEVAYEQRGPKRTKLRDKSYRPPVVSSSGSSEDKKD